MWILYALPYGNSDQRMRKNDSDDKARSFLLPAGKGRTGDDGCNPELRQMRKVYGQVSIFPADSYSLGEESEGLPGYPLWKDQRKRHRGCKELSLRP